MRRSTLLTFILLLHAALLTGTEATPSSRQAPQLTGIWILPSPTALNQEGYEQLDGICSQIDIPGSPDQLQNLLKGEYLNQPINRQTIANIKKSIADFYRRQSRPIVAVVFPKQDISTGVIQLVVVEGRVGGVEVHGNRYFSDERLLKYFNIQPGEVIRSDVINNDLAAINSNPFRQANLVFKPGKTSGLTDLELVVQDRRTYRFYGGIDNTGNSVIGNNRLFAGFDWGNVFGWDHILSFQFSTADDFKEFLGYTLHYTMPLYIRDTLEIYGGYSTVESNFELSGVPLSPFRNHGYSAQASIRYDVPVNFLYNTLEELSCGFDFKRMNNNLEFGGTPVIANQVNLFQLMLSGNFGYESQKWIATWEIEGFVSPGDWLPDQSNNTYQSLRPFAKNTYVYARSAFSLMYKFSGWLYSSLYLRGQAASGNLLPSEEFGVGGYDTVRGYQEREANGDNAFVGNFEFISAPFPFSRCFNIRNGSDHMQLLAFFDYGAAFIHHPSPGEKKNQHLYSVGPGLRYQYASYVTARIDWGFQLHRITPDTPQQRLHFQFIASY